MVLQLSFFLPKFTISWSECKQYKIVRIICSSLLSVKKIVTVTKKLINSFVYVRVYKYALYGWN